MMWTIRQRSERAGLATIEAGSGQPVILLHGVGLRAEAWNRQIDALASRYHVIAPDMPGHGESPVPSAKVKLPNYVQNVEAVLSTLDAPAIVIGHSMGAMIALDIACQNNASIRGVIALNAVFERSDAASEAVRARANSLDGTSVADPSGTLQRWFGRALSKERNACEDWLKSVSPLGYKLAYEAFAHSDGPSRTALAQLNCPALFMTGGLEPNSTSQMSRQMAELAANGRAIILEDAAHMMPMTHAETVNEALIDFAREVWS